MNSSTNSQLCPFSPERIENIDWSSASQLREIEHHVHSVPQNCPGYHPPLNQIILPGQFNGSTPLLRACRGDSLESIKIIIEEWGVDVNSTATYHRLDKTIHGVAPVFVAASRGNLKLLEYLLDKGADLNVRTALNNSLVPHHPGMSPLHATALFLRLCRQQGSVIEFLIRNGADPSALTANGSPMWMLAGYDVNATRLLINLGMSLTQKSPQLGRTILHFWAGRTKDARSLSIVELLLAKGSDLEALDINGISPINVAAIGTNGVPNLPVLDYLLRRNDLTPLQRIEALELAGSTILCVKDDQTSVTRAFQYWNEAMDLRDSNSIPKLLKNSDRQAVEWTTKNQLRELQHSPFEYKIQAILVRHRCLSRLSIGALAGYLYPFIHPYCLKLRTDHRLSKLLDVCWFMLEEAASLNGPYDKDTWVMIIKVTNALVFTLKTLKDERNAILKSDTLRISLELIVATHLIGVYNPSNIAANGLLMPTKDHLETLVKLVSILAGLPDVLNHQIMCCLYQLVKLNPKNQQGQNLLLTACLRLNANDQLETVGLLLRVGADPNPVDVNGDSVLHILAARMGVEINSPTADLLLKSGTHYDNVNKKGETALDVWKKGRAESSPPPSWSTRTVPNLTCWCARAIASKDECQDLPKTLYDFVDMH